MTYQLKCLNNGRKKMMGEEGKLFIKVFVCFLRGQGNQKWKWHCISSCNVFMPFVVVILGFGFVFYFLFVMCSTVTVRKDTDMSVYKW